MIVLAALTISAMMGCRDDEKKDSLRDAAVDGGPDGESDGGSRSDGSGVADSATGDAALADGGVLPPVACGPLDPPSGDVVEVHPADADSLRDIVGSAATGTTVLLHDGTYDMSGGDSIHRLVFSTPGVTLRSASGNPQNVVLDGGYVTGELVSIAASNITIAELTLTRAYYHPIHVTGAADADIENTRIYRVRIIDPGEQAIKVNPSTQNHYADNGIVECCHLELTDSGRAEIRNNCYTGGVDAHAAWNWVIRLNTIVGFWCSSGLSEHGIHLWRKCRATLVERNQIIDCARSIGFGLAETAAVNERQYPDDPYPNSGYMDHIDGVIRNNFVFAQSSALFASDFGFDSGIALAQARGAKVVHNTVVSTQAPFASLEYRFENTAAEIKNNLLSHNLMERNNAQADCAGNQEEAPLTFFVDGAGGDLHLDTVGGVAAIDAGVDLAAGLCDEDIDGEMRSGPRDVGADEVQP
jgi:hypothetical protein